MAGSSLESTRSRAPRALHRLSPRLSDDACRVPAQLGARGATVAAIHPAMTFTGDPQEEARRMVGARFAVTAPEEAQATANAVVETLGGVPVRVAEARRVLYHAALSHAANHLVTLIAGARDALRLAGVEEPGALLEPLARAALANSLDRGMAALSGPIARGDVETLVAHVEAIEESAPALLPAYRAMALATIDGVDHGDQKKEGLRQALRS